MIFKKYSFLIFFLALSYFFLEAGLPDACAWGPGVHMIAGNWVLQNLSALPWAVSSVVMAYPGQFLYGSLSPDIFIGKGSVSKKGHSHNWQTGLLLLRLADSPQCKAYAYGYLSHLAADTVAHNVYVPQKADMALGQGRLAHIYLEMQADRLLKWDSVDALSVFQEKQSKDSRALLRKISRHDPLSFWFKNKIYRQSIAIGGARPWKYAMGYLDKLVSGEKNVAFAGHMLTVSARAIINLLQDIKNSPVRQLDPIGTGALEGLQGQSLNAIPARVLQDLLISRTNEKAPSAQGEQLKDLYAEQDQLYMGKNFSNELVLPVNYDADGEKNNQELAADYCLEDLADSEKFLLPDANKLIGLIESPEISLASAESFDLPEILSELPPVCILKES